MRLTTLVDNCVRGPELLAQHGFSLWIEGDFGRILFDTGATAEVLLGNAKVLGVDLGSADHIVLSHGHWDHGGGLLAAMQAAPKAQVWIPKGALLPRVHGRGEAARDIALSPEVRMHLTLNRSRWQEIDGPMEIAPGTWLTGPVPGKRPAWSHVGLWRSAQLDVPDDVPEEQALVLTGMAGLVVVSGCAHYGLPALLKAVLGLGLHRRIAALVGGLHLESAGQGELETLGEAMEEIPVGELHPAHCSGAEAACTLAQRLGVPFRYGRVGQILSF